MEHYSSHTRTRWDLIGRLGAHLAATRNPKAQMLALVFATGVIGLMTSVGLLHLRLRNMALRYTISVAVAYAGFLGLVRLWISFEERHWLRTGGPRLDGVRAKVEEQQRGEARDPSWWLDGIDLPDSEELIGVVLVIGGAIALLLLIWRTYALVELGQDFFAEILLDSVLSAGLYRQLEDIERRHWMETAVAKTRGLFICAVIFFAIFGLISAHYAPESVSIGGVVRHLLAD